MRLSIVLRWFLIFLLPHLAVAEESTLKFSIDPKGSGFSIGGWDRQERDTGTIFYTCQVEQCEKGSIVSVHLQNYVGLSREDIKKHGEMANEFTMKRFKGAIERIELDEPKITAEPLLRFGEVHRTIILKTTSSIGIKLYWTTGFTEAKGKTFTLSSEADSRGVADKNFEVFMLVTSLVLTKEK
ncbi:MAG TPA: hypothetical protein VM144_15400 [Aestuariivirga sp.]|nr:hypothetical protein [Aestuariivirga sp.]